MEEILQWLKLLTVTERTQLLKFLKSEFFNSSKAIVHLYQNIRDHLEQNRTEKAWDEQMQADKIYGATQVVEAKTQSDEEEALGKQQAINFNVQHITPNVRKIRRHVSKLKQLIPQFIAHHALKNDNTKRLPVLIAELSRRMDKELFDQACDEYKKILDPALLDADNYGNLAWLHREHHHYPTAERFTPNLHNLRATNEYLDRHYLALKLRHITESLIRKNLFQEEKSIESTNIVLQLAEHYYNKDLLIRAYVDIITLVREGYDKQRYLAYEAHYLKNKSNFSPKDQQAIVLATVNLCYNWIVKQLDNNLISSYILWIKESIMGKNSFHFFLQNESFSNDLFLSIACAAAIAKDFAFLEKFTSNYATYLSPERRKDVLMIVDAYRLLHKDYYTEAYEVIHKRYNEFVRDEFIYAIRARMVRIRYHLMMFLREGECEKAFRDDKYAFLRYLERESSIHDNRKKAYRNFLHVLDRLAAMKDPDKNSRENRLQLATEVSQLSPLIGGHWLLRVIDTELPNASL